MRVLVTGGAGYIGSHTVKELLKNKHQVIVLDNLATGHRSSLPNNVTFIKGDIADKLLVKSLLQKYQIEAVIHFAAFSIVNESMVKPAKYFINNVAGSIALFENMIEKGVKYVVFSSSAAVYGEPPKCPIREDTPKCPTNNYGLSKMMIEQILHSFDVAYGLKYIALRYFNAAGADASGDIGEDHEPETHLIPLVLKTALGQRDKVYVFGTDYQTTDGTCVRDYVHVIDLAKAHVLALECLAKGCKSEVYNLGNGQGYSVKQIIDSAIKVTGRDIPVQFTGRRAGDPAILVAESEKVKEELGWEPKFKDMNSIVETAWKWHLKNPSGFR